MAKFRKDMDALKKQDFSKRSRSSGSSVPSTAPMFTSSSSSGGDGEGAAITILLIGGGIAAAIYAVLALFGWLFGLVHDLWTGIATAVTQHPFDTALYVAILALSLLAVRCFVVLRSGPVIIAAALIAVASALLVYFVQSWPIKSFTFEPRWMTYTARTITWGFPVYSVAIACLILPLTRHMNDIDFADFVPILLSTGWKAFLIIWVGIWTLIWISGANQQLHWGTILPSAGFALKVTLLFSASLFTAWMHQRV